MMNFYSTIKVFNLPLCGYFVVSYYSRINGLEIFACLPIEQMRPAFSR